MKDIRDSRFLDETRKKRLTVASAYSVSMCVPLERIGKLLGVGPSLKKRIANHAGEMATIDMRCSEVADGADHGRHRKSVDHCPVLPGHLCQVDSDVRSPGLLPLSAGELGIVGL